MTAHAPHQAVKVRLRERRDGALFAAMWDLAFVFTPGESHIRPLSDGRLMRLLGNQYRRERGDFAAIGSRGPETRGA